MTEPSPPSAAVRQAAESTFRRFAVVGAGASLAWAPLWFLSGVPSIGCALLAAGAAIAAAYAGRRRLGLELAGNLAVAAAVAVVLGVVAVTGGIDGTRGVWVFVLPVAIALPLGVRAAAAWGAGLVAAVAVLWTLELRGFPFPDLVPAEHHAPVGAAVHLTVLTLILLLSLAYARTRAATVRSLHEANRSLEVVSADRERRAGRLAVLVDVARILASERSPDRLYRAFYVQVGRVLRRDAFYVALWDEASGTMRYALMYDEGKEYPGDHHVPLGEGPTSRAIRERRTVVRSGEGEAGGTPWGNTARSARAAVHAPLVKEGRVLGVLGVFSYASPYSDEDVRLFESLADQAAVAVENALLDRRVSESEARFREVLASIERMVGHAVVITGLDGRIQYAGGTESVHGYPPEELVGRHVSALGRNVPEAGEITDEFMSAIDRGEPWTRAVTATRKGGDNFPILISASPYYGSGGEMSGVVTIGVDLTEQVEGERRLMQSAKLAAIGELVAGVAHELNNPLTVVKTTATLLEAELSGEAAADARAIREHADRAARIVRGLLHFARQSPPERLPTDLNEVAGRVCGFRRGGAARRARGAGDPLRPGAPPHAGGRPAAGAGGAQPGEQRGAGHRLRAGARPGDGDHRGRRGGAPPPRGGRRPRHPRGGARPRLRPVLHHARGGRGDGAGAGRVARHRGRARRQHHRALGARRGRSVHRGDPAGPGAGGGRRAAAPRRRGTPAPASRRVLVVDDEAGLRRIVRRYLEGRGHRVDEAGSGAEALERVAAAAYDTVLLDLKMPEMTGDELFRILRERHPETAARVVFATGDVISPARKAFLDGSGRPAFEKPFDLGEVAAVVEGTAGNRE